MPMRALAVAVLLAVLSVPLLAGAEEQPKDSELRAAKALDAIRGDPLALYAFLKRMPKGADLHKSSRRGGLCRDLHPRWR